MIHWPTINEYIDFHTYNKEKEKGVFRVYNQLITNTEEDVYPEVRSVGLHPWDIKDFKFLNQIDNILEKNISEDSCLFVGECGLDKSISTTIDQQLEGSNVIFL